MFDLDTKVVCVDDSFPPGINDIYNALPRKGALYTVRDIIPAQDAALKPTTAILLHELRNNPNKHGIEPAFQLWRFREPTAEELEESEKESEALTA